MFLPNFLYVATGRRIPGGSPIWAMEVVKATYFFLKEKQGVADCTSAVVAKFLEWDETKVQNIFENLRSAREIPQAQTAAHEEQPHIKKEVFAELPTQKHATEFRRERAQSPLDTKVSKPNHESH